MIGVFSDLWRGLRRDLRSSELAWLFVALTLSVAALSSVSFLADRMQRAFQFDARQLIASDLLIVGDQPVPESFIQEAQRRKLQIAQTVVFPSMASVGQQSKLSSLKAVSASYPLRGQLQASRTDTTGPRRGSVWVDPAVLASLHAKVGDQISLGRQHFLIDAVLLRELDRGAGFMNFSPRIMMSLDDLPATGLIVLGSRATYRLLLAGSDEDVLAYETWVKSQIRSEALRGLRVETLENAQPLMRKTLDRAERFLSLIALLTAMVAAVAIALSARRYVVGQADACAVLKCFGASQKMIFNRQLKTLFAIGIATAVLGSCIGYLVQQVLLSLLGGLILANLPPISLWPVLWSILFAWFLLIGFAAPTFFSLVKVNPIRLVRKEFEGISVAGIWLAIFGLLSCLTLIVIAARDWRLAAWVGLSFGIATAIFILLALGLLKLLGCIQVTSFPMRFALTMQIRRSGFAVMQITALGIALMALLMILLLRQDLLSTWRGTLPVDAPNRFMINIQDDQKEGVAQMLSKAGLAQPEFYPMIRGRLIDINGRSIGPSDYDDDNARRLVDREFNLSYTSQLPPGNRITVGKWIEGAQPQVSIETGIAKTLNLHLGDQLSFEVAGEKVTAPITSFRKLDWGSMRVNFFVIMPPQLLKGLPQSWITAYYQAPNIQNLDFQLTQAFPNLTVVDVAVSLAQVQEVLDRLSLALGVLFAFTIAAAILVLMAAIAATQDERFRSAALLKAMGASQATLGKIAAIELAVIGLISGALAGIASALAAWALGRFVLEIEFHACMPAIMMGITFGLIACGLAGFQFFRKIQHASALQCLRDGA